MITTFEKYKKSLDLLESSIKNMNDQMKEMLNAKDLVGKELS